MFYRNSAAFEEAVFGESSARKLNLCKFREEGLADFDESVRELIRNPDSSFPNTEIGASLHHFVERELRSVCAPTEGLIFRSAINTPLEQGLFTDGLFHLPAADRFPVTVDLFNLDSANLIGLKSLWIDRYPGLFYSYWNMQNDLFCYKDGLFEWKDNLRMKANNIAPFDFLDFRLFAKCSRPANHVILTPYDTLNYQRRRNFAKMVARYLASKVPGHKMAQPQP